MTVFNYSSLCTDGQLNSNVIINTTKHVSLSFAYNNRFQFSLSVVWKHKRNIKPDLKKLNLLLKSLTYSAAFQPDGICPLKCYSANSQPDAGPGGPGIPDLIRRLRLAARKIYICGLVLSPTRRFQPARNRANRN